MRREEHAAREVRVGLDVEALAETLVALFHPHVEVALHDQRAGRVHAVWNPLADVRAGDESDVDGDLLRQGQSGDVIGPLRRLDSHGRVTSSVYVHTGDGRFLVGITFDRSPLEAAIRALAALGAPPADVGVPPIDGDWRVTLNESVANWCASRALSPRDLDRDSRAKLVVHLERWGLLDSRPAIDHLAQILGVPRSVIRRLHLEARV